MNTYVKSITILILMGSIGSLFFFLFTQKKSNGHPASQEVMQRDSLSYRPMTNDFYFPIDMAYRTGYYIDDHKNISDTTFYDTSLVENASTFLRNAEEPILSEKYLGLDSYRLIVINPPELKISIRLTKYEDKVEVKYYSETIKVYPKADTSIDKKEYEISTVYWDTLSVLINKSEYWTTMPRIIVNDKRGEWVWFLEGQTQSAYKIVRRWVDLRDYYFTAICTHLLYIADSKLPVGEESSLNNFFRP